MNLDAGSQSGLRRAALALHALGDLDREWLLQRLPAAQAALQELLIELRELQMPADAAIIRAALGEAAASIDMSGAQSASLALALAAEPLALQSQLLATLDEPERRAVLAGWPELRPLPLANAEPDWTDALREALLLSWRETASRNVRRGA